MNSAARSARTYAIIISMAIAREIIRDNPPRASRMPRRIRRRKQKSPWGRGPANPDSRKTRSHAEDFKFSPAGLGKLTAPIHSHNQEEGRLQAGH